MATLKISFTRFSTPTKLESENRMPAAFEIVLKETGLIPQNSCYLMI
jgi:hypothetical protein